MSTHSAELARGTTRRRLAALVAELCARNVDEAESVAWLLLSDVLGCRPLELPLHDARVLTDAEEARLSAFARRAAAHEPVQYILARAEFLGHEFRVDRRTLIPRQDTERVVEIVLREGISAGAADPRVVEVGTGSGCIVISLALAWPRATFRAIDRSASALELARENAARHSVLERIEWVQGSLLDGLPARSADLIVANLPYIPSAEIEGLPPSVRDFEPHSALDGGADGLVPIRQLTDQAAQVLGCGGLLFLEIGHDQGAAVRELLHAAGFAEIQIEQDYGRRDRVAWGHVPRA